VSGSWSATSAEDVQQIDGELNKSEQSVSK
jgi:hypothetical protein